MIKLVVLDLDGTLLTFDKQLPESTVETIKEVRRKGIDVVLSTGRAISTLSDFRERLGMTQGYTSGMNGGCIYFGGELVKEHRMRLSDGLHILRELKKIPEAADFIRIYDTPVRSVIEKESIFSDYYTKVTGLVPKLVDSFETALESDIYKVLVMTENSVLLGISELMNTRKPEGINMFFSSENMLEFTPAEATKGNALRYLAKAYNVNLEETFAMGDSFNDISMLELAGVAVCPKNADSEVKKYAHFVTDNDSDNDAVSEALRKYVL